MSIGIVLTPLRLVAGAVTAAAAAAYTARMTTGVAASPSSSLVVLYGIGGLSDVGRHAILAALEQPSVRKITVITEYPELLDESVPGDIRIPRRTPRKIVLLLA